MSELSERIRANCIEDGDCLIWPGRVSDAGMPVMTVDGSSVSVRRVLYEQEHGPVTRRLLVTPTCGHMRCMFHLEALTPKASKALSVSRGAYRNPARARKAALTNRARSHITDETVATIKAADSAREAHEATGVNLSYVYVIRAGVARADMGNPFAGLGGRA